MVRKVFFLLIFASGLFANSIDFAIISMLGGKEFKENQKFIQRLFVKKQYFSDENGNPNLYKIAKTLKANGLLKLSFSGVKELEISFQLQGNPASFVNVLYNSLNAMGYYYFMTKQSTLEKGDYQVVLSMNTEYAVDPVLFQENLRKYGYKVTNIEKQDLTHWKYTLIEQNFKYPKATLLELNTENSDTNLGGEYWYKINTGTKLELNSAYNKNWYPKIVFYNGNLEILGIYLHEKLTKNLSVEIPENTVYIKITDMFVPANIKGGLSVVLKSQK